MYSKPKKEILQKTGIQKTNNIISLLNYSLGKDGFFRANLNGVRVGRSCRTVITPNPYISCNQVVCPQTIASIISVPVRVNSQNINQLYSLIQNYPNYPCALQINDNRPINPYNQSSIVIIPGDIVYRQIIDGDICLTNRYPSVREESFGGAKVKIVSQQQSIQFNLSVIDKFNADFDGDEMQLFFCARPSNNVEISLLSSVYQQFIEYVSSKNIVGGAKDLSAGIYNIQQFNTNLPILQSAVSFIDNYDDQDIIIKDHSLEQFSSKLADSDSDFLTFIAYKYGTSYAVNIIDTVIKACYLTNEKYSYSLYYTIFDTNSKDQDHYEQDRIKQASALLKKLYSNQFISPLGVSKSRFFNLYLQSQLTMNQLIQNQLIISQYASSDDYSKIYTKDINKNLIAIHSAVVSIGYCNDDQNNNIITQPRYLCCYPKFSESILDQGYVTQNYIKGLDQTAQFLISLLGRRQVYIKGNVIRDSGYMQRRIQKAFDNVYSGQNQIIFGNNYTIISFQFGASSLDSRYNIPNTVSYNPEWTEDQKNIYQYFYSLQQQLQPDYKPIESSSLTFILPFNASLLNIQSISTADLQFILSYRLTSNMSPQFKEIIFQQQLPIFAYFYLSYPINNKQSSSTIIPQLLLKSTLSAGDSIGIKAAMAITGPLSQDTLDAIHHSQSSSGRIQYIQEDTLEDPQRFLELTQATNEYTQFSAQLLTPDDEDLATQFIQKYQTLSLSKLEPTIDIYYYQKQQFFDINILFDNLSYNNVNLLQLITDLQSFLDNKKIDIIRQQNQITLQFIFPLSIHQETLIQYRSQLLSTFQFGSLILYNLYYSESTINDKKQYFIKGNIFSGKELQLYSIQELNPYTISISSIPFFSSHFSIFHTEQQLFNQYSHTLSNISVVKGTNKSFIQLFSSFQTQSGKYTGFQRFDYKKDKNRDFIQNIIYEEGASFVIKAVQSQQWFSTSTYQNSQLFGTKCQSGTDISEYYSQYI